MATSLEDLRMLQQAEKVAKQIWAIAKSWDYFAKDTVGKQLVRSTDSVGANIAESFGRFHYGEKIQFLYYARGSVYESKYWVNLALDRNLISAIQHKELAKDIAEIALQINVFVKSLKSQRKPKKNVLKEESAVYETEQNIFTTPEIEDLKKSPNLLIS